MREIFGRLVSVAIFSLFLIVANVTAAETIKNCPSGHPRVSLDNGVKYCGRTNSLKIQTFQGIKYGEAKRFQYPKPFTPTDKKQFHVAQGYGNVCPQKHGITDPPQKGSVTIGSEDCLFLNIWAPADAAPGKNYPVMFFIHGGAFIFGSASDGAILVNPDGNVTFKQDGSMYDGTNFALQDVILVSINYRLGALGFLNWSPFGKAIGKGIGSIKGNFGIADQILAMKWVEDNIERFGGDKSKITIFGESAGAMSVGLLNFSSPEANGIMSAAIMESNPMGVLYENGDVDKGRPHGQAVAEAFFASICGKGKNAAECALYIIGSFVGTLSLDEIMKAQTKAELASVALFVDKNKTKWTNVLPFIPIVGTTSSAPDGFDLIAQQPLDGYKIDSSNKLAAGFSAKPMMYGTNRDEGDLFINMILKGNIITTGIYEGMLGALFKSPTNQLEALEEIESEQVTGFGATKTLNPYCPGKTKLATTRHAKYCQDTEATPGFLKKSPANALSNIASDYIFRCANHNTGQNVANKTAAPVYSYTFTNQPVLSVFGSPEDGNPCNSFDPDANLGGIAVCHGYELPFVFDTIETAFTPQALRDKSDSDYVAFTKVYNNALILADHMNKDWASFAKDPAAFSPSTGGGRILPSGSGGTDKEKLFIAYGNQEPWPNSAKVGLVDAEQCGSLWFKTAVPVRP